MHRFGRKKPLPQISHEGGERWCALSAWDLIDGDLLLLLLLHSHKSQEELKVEKWVSVSWDVKADRVEGPHLTRRLIK